MDFLHNSFLNLISGKFTANLSCNMKILLSSTALPIQLPTSTNGQSYIPGVLQLVSSEDSTFQFHLVGEAICLPYDIFSCKMRRTAVADCIYRNFFATVVVMQSLGADLPIVTPTHDQYILHRSNIDISPVTGVISIRFRVLRMSNERANIFLETTFPTMIKQWLISSQVNDPTVTAYWHCLEDQCTLRKLVSALGASFVANGSILPRAGGTDDRPLSGKSVVPFISPESLEVQFRLPHRGMISGMLIPKGVTVITGGGYHGKSTILNALKVGIYNKVPGDGREFVVTDSSAISIRSEDGRYVAGVDVSPFINNLPAVANIDPRSFSTSSASGSTSMAANIIESMEFNPQLLLLDEDTCASNFMIRDSRMRAMISNEPITPFIYRVNALHKEKGISTIVVIGGSGDWFDVQDTTIMMDNYNCLDVSKKARSICKTFCTGRVQFNGRGLVHQLPWPCDFREEKNLENIDSSFIDESIEIGKKKEAFHARRLLSHIDLPCNLSDGGSISASENGHHITFFSSANLHSRRIKKNCEEHLSVKRKFTDITHSSGDVIKADLGGCSNIGSDEISNETNGIVDNKTLDLSKLEQRIMSKEGALGIALAVCFVHLTLCSENNDGNTNCSRDLYVLLRRFDRVRSWKESVLRATVLIHMSTASSAGSPDSVAEALEIDSLVRDIDPILHDEKFINSENVENLPSDRVRIDRVGIPHEKQIASDFQMVLSIYRKLMNEQSFVWPRIFEAAAAINRMKGAQF